ncbi:hypothetical protein CDEST_03509 [Colletotrichum destructivum]|uniref:Uncharacterized protein n=1 Tax=Colletotrichum destructivum TaxID=34406 RepID=A0AAX4I672_9PEZI|nr:hypothetical protein CDEST_03509 [Colletotrichum destructivum]
MEPERFPLAVDGPTKLLLLSCYAKIFQAYRQMFTEVYSGLRSGANMTDLLYDLRVEDIVLDGDDELKILVLIQVVIHKLNTVGVHLGVPERHYVGVGSGTPLGTMRTQSRGLQSSLEEAEPTLDAILSGNESDRCVFGGEFKEQNRCMESAAAAFREELGLLRAQLGHWSRCRTVPLGESHGF